MKYATALCLALAGGWATEHEAFRPPMNSDLLFRRSRRHSHPTTPSSSLQRDVSSSLSRNTLCHLPVTQTSTSTTTRLYLAANKKQPPHPPNQPPPDSILKDDKDDDDDNNDETTSTSTSSSTSILSYFTKQAINPNRTPFFTADPVERQAQQAQRQELVQRSLLQAKLRNDALSYAIRVAQELEQQANTSNTSPPPPTTSIEAPPIPPIRPITKIPAKPLVTPSQQEEFQRGLARFYQDIVSPLSEVQPGVPKETIQGAALAAATLAFLASKGLMVTSAAGLSAAYLAISQGIAGDVARTVGGIAWDVQTSALKLLEMANPNIMTGLSKELVAQVAAALEESKEWNESLLALQAQEDKAKQQKKQLATNGEQPPQESSDSEDDDDAMPDLSKILEEAETAINAADAAIAQADETLLEDDEADDDNESVRLEEEARLQAEAEAIAAAEEEAMRLAAEAEAKRKQEEAEEQARLAAEEEAKQKQEEEAAAAAEEEAMRLAAEAEAKRKQDEAVDQCRLAAEEEAKRKQEEEAAAAAEEEAMRLAAEAEAKRKQEEAEEQARLEEAKRTQEEDQAADAEEEEDEDDDWLAAVELAQQGLEGKVVGLDEAIQDDTAKASWDKAGELAQELNSSVEDDDDDDDDLDLDLGKMAALAQAARAAVEKYEARSGLGDQTEEDEDDDDYDDSDDLVEVFGDDGFEEFEEDPFQGIDGMVISSSSSSSSSSAMPQSEQYATDWSTLTAQKLKDELRLRGLKAYGPKVELIQRLDLDDIERQKAAAANAAGSEEDEDDLLSIGEFDLAELGRQARAAVEQEVSDAAITQIADMEQDEDEADGQSDDIGDDDEDSDDDLFDIDDIDIDELGRQARAAVELGAAALLDVDLDAEEPSDEVLMRLESEESLLLNPLLEDDDDAFLLDDDEEDEDGKEVDNTSSETTGVDYWMMNVVQLKDELRSRGLKISGRKSDLIDRLEEFDNLP